MKEFESLTDLQAYLTENHIREIAIQNLDLDQIEPLLLKIKFERCLFLGCHMSGRLFTHLQEGNYIFPHLEVPYNIYPNRLYDKDVLYKGYDHRRPETYLSTLDKVVYDHYIHTGKETHNIVETLARRLHDHSITDSLQEFLTEYEEKRVVAIMGGHGLSRDTLSYRQIAEISRTLTERGYLMISGGGPGAMEATHVGAWFAGRPVEELDLAIAHLSKAPTYDHVEWLPTAFQVLEQYPDTTYRSLGVPTWLYGHEPPTPFATHIAKYFANSVREEGLLAIAKGGVIFAPGSAGTMQEIFQDIAQNHYESFGYASPMVFLNREYWSYERPVYPVIELMHLRGNLSNLDLGIYDSTEKVVEHIERFRQKE
jgi:predicted Rossmann-fold nucleotide-binding protein